MVIYETALSEFLLVHIFAFAINFKRRRSRVFRGQKVVRKVVRSRPYFATRLLVVVVVVLLSYVLGKHLRSCRDGQ